MPEAGELIKLGVQGLLISVLWGYIKINAKREAKQMELLEKAIEAQRQVAIELRLMRSEMARHKR